jgi:hypothetical protein
MVFQESDFYDFLHDFGPENFFFSIWPMYFNTENTSRLISKKSKKNLFEPSNCASCGSIIEVSRIFRNQSISVLCIEIHRKDRNFGRKNYLGCSRQFWKIKKSNFWASIKVLDFLEPEFYFFQSHVNVLTVSQFLAYRKV